MDWSGMLVRFCDDMDKMIRSPRNEAPDPVDME